MNIDELKYFLAVRKYQNFSFAAEELSLSQSSLSKHIKNLESEFNTIFFDRKSRNLTLTEAGQDFIVYAEKLLNNYQEMVINMKKHSNLEKGKIHLAAIPIMSQYGITTLIAAFSNAHPHIHLEILEQEHDLILEMIRNSEIDLAIIRMNYIPGGLVNIYPLMDDELVLVTNKDHPLANQPAVSIDELKYEKFILLNATSGVYQTCIDECKKAEFSPHILYTNSRIETIIGLVGEGLGVTLLMKRAIESFEQSKLSIVALNKKVPSTLALVTPKRKEESDITKVFINFITHSIVYHS
ncbi:MULTISPECIES: LysR family transcriptional regulator [Paraliobacillus]|uniref:LysR family transcriptional regulator n=1 Tax=Paraliobacillus TaxID=200903 RepID=UPI000E3DF7F7|nr:MULTISPECIES: LysR family transcriptional regulator [Paraliobacillus]